MLLQPFHKINKPLEVKIIFTIAMRFKVDFVPKKKKKPVWVPLFRFTEY